MGYYTRYELEHVSDGRESDLVSSINYGHSMLTEAEPAKWYTHEAEIAAAMRELQIKAVHLKGIGEEYGDIWFKEFLLDGPNVIVAEFKAQVIKPDTATSLRRI